MKTQLTSYDSAIASGEGFETSLISLLSNTKFKEAFIYLLYIVLTRPC